ncbi:hypothetical protein F9L02_22835 [Brucella intermedia]|nr:hypothetical protein F9L02_22835 [Brucella intermedia]
MRSVFKKNFQVYDVQKVWCQLQREGLNIVPCTAARIMRMMGVGAIISGFPE